MDQVLAIERRRRTLRIVLFAIILATLPCYCAGFLLWATAPQGGAAAIPGSARTATPTFTPLAVNATRTPPQVITPLPLTGTAFNPIQPTPGQFFPPAVTRILSPTPLLFPTLTLAPTLTPIPTIALPTETPFVFPSPTPALPTATPLPDLPTPTLLPPIDIPTLEPTKAP
jgi:hypothetical protein